MPGLSVALVGAYGRVVIDVVPVDRSNVARACRLTLKPGQEEFVAPVAVSLAEA